jgi:hypothetical protein
MPIRFIWQIYNQGLELAQIFIIFDYYMQPDYPHKLFSDKRNSYSLLMLTLAMDSVD